MSSSNEPPDNKQEPLGSPQKLESTKWLYIEVMK